MIAIESATRTSLFAQQSRAGSCPRTLEDGRKAHRWVIGHFDKFIDKFLHIIFQLENVGIATIFASGIKLVKSYMKRDRTCQNILTLDSKNYMNRAPCAIKLASCGCESMATAFRLKLLLSAATNSSETPAGGAVGVIQSYTLQVVAVS